MRTLRLLAAALLATFAPAAALACSPPPAGYVVPKPSQAEYDKAALSIYRASAYIAQVVVERPPRQRRRNEPPPPPGRLRVLAAIKGDPPPIIEVPGADPCSLYFQRVGERLIVSVRATEGAPRPFEWPQILIDETISSMRRHGLGDWSRVL